MASCSMVNEDFPECAVAPNTITTVNFVYDYNMQGRDLFDQHVGSVHLYVFDQDQTFVFDSVSSRTMMPGKDVDFTMVFDTVRLKPGREYYMVAMAQGNHAGYEASLETPGFQIPLQYEMIPGVSKLSSYRVMLDRDSDSYADLGIVNYKDAYGNNREMMDTLWSTKPGEIQRIHIPMLDYTPSVKEIPTQYVDVTIPMMRITNAVTVNLVHDSFHADTDPNRFNVIMDFPNGNGTISFTGETLPNRQLIYRSLRKESVPYRQKPDNVPYDDTRSGGTRAGDGYAIQATFGVSRLQATDGSSLQIINPETGEVVVKIGGEGDDSFSKWLAEYFVRYADEYQEFLDKEYEFTIDIHLNDDYVWDWYQIGCEILGWGVREYLYDLH